MRIISWLNALMGNDFLRLYSTILQGRRDTKRPLHRYI